jgi:PAS domain S-box-containing protein
MKTKPNRGNILVVDDKPANLKVLTLMLTEQGYQVHPAINGQVALAAVREVAPDLILLGIMMPEMDGYEVCQRLKADEQTRDIPVIFISARGETRDKVKAFSVGGVDYITKPFQTDEVLARIETHLSLRNIQKQLEAQDVQLHRANDELACINNELAREIAERKRAEEVLQKLAHGLGERVKELNCLYGISNLVETPDISLEEIVEGTVDLIPPAWQYPEITCARIILEGQEFSTKNFQESPWKQAADILVFGERSGTVQVGYLQEKPQSDEGPFLKEERSLLNSIAERLGKITERTRAEQQVHEQCQFLQIVLDSLSYPFYVINVQDRTVEMANSAAYTGPLRGDMTCHALVHGHDQPCETVEHPCPLQEVRRTKKPVILEHVHLDKDGRRRDVEVHGFPIFDREGNVVQMIEYGLDITERKQTEEALQESEERWRSLTETSPDHILTLDADLNIQFANFASPGLTVKELIGTPLYTYVEEERQAEIKAILEDVLRTGEEARYETVYYTPDGTTIYYESRVTPRRLPGSDEIIGLTLSSRDITERKQIQVQEQQLAALEERERIGRELHDDLGQVMGYVNVQTQAALTRLEQGEVAQVKAVLSQLAQVAQQAHYDVRQYILGIRTTAAQPPPDFFAALEGYLDMLREHYGLETQVSWPEDVVDSPFAPEVETQLLRIIQEALTNVRKHAGVDTARLLFTLHTDEVQVIIEDDGHGFDPTSSLQPPTSSLQPPTHFGLSIMRERAESVGGGLEVRSALGEGTCVIVRVPLSLVPSPQERLVRGVRVLLVDDHPLYLEGLRGLLASRGLHVVGQAHDGLEALEQARALHPELILMDVQMPRCDGVEATQRIKAELPEVKIVMLTMASEGHILFEALKSGASGYLLKSLDGAKFFSMLADVMRGETVLSPALASQVLAEFARKPDDETVDTSPLTPRQQEVLELVAQGTTNQEIARALYVSESTVKYHVSQILERLHLQSRYQLAQYAQERGLAPPLYDE